MNTEAQSQGVDGTTGDLYGLTVDTSVMFSNHKGIYKRRIEKRQRRLLRNFSSLSTFLYGGEKILHVTTGLSPLSFIDYFLATLAILYVKRAVFVVTNWRVFHIPIKKNLKYRNSIAHILYSDCTFLDIRGSKLVANYKSGRKEKFLYIARRERKKIKSILRNQVSFEGNPSGDQQRHHLCPRCAFPLINDNFICSNCSLEFKSKAKARKLSIIFPGGGYFYTRHPWIGFLDACAEIYISVLLVLVLIGTFTRTIEEGYFLCFTFFMILVIEKIVTIHHAYSFIKEFIPRFGVIQLLQYNDSPVPHYSQDKPERPGHTIQAEPETEQATFNNGWRGE